MTYDAAAVVKSPHRSAPDEFWGAEVVWVLFGSAGCVSKSSNRSLLVDGLTEAFELGFAGSWEEICWAGFETGGGSFTPPGGGGNKPGVPLKAVVFGRGFELPVFLFYNIFKNVL